jgi:hypothetical protein
MIGLSAPDDFFEVLYNLYQHFLFYKIDKQNIKDITCYKRYVIVITLTMSIDIMTLLLFG